MMRRLCSPLTKTKQGHLHPTGSGRKYRVGIFYKSATAVGLSEVKCIGATPEPTLKLNCNRATRVRLCEARYKA